MGAQKNFTFDVRDGAKRVVPIEKTIGELYQEQRIGSGQLRLYMTTHCIHSIASEMESESRLRDLPIVKVRCSLYSLMVVFRIGNTEIDYWE